MEVNKTKGKNQNEDKPDGEIIKATKENLKNTISKAERFALLALSCATVFLALSLAEPKQGAVVEWELLGFPLSIDPPLALVALYLIYFFSSLLADNLIIHASDLIKELAPEQAFIVLRHPAILTVSPLGTFFTTITPGILIAVGIFNMSRHYPVDNILLIGFAGFGLLLGVDVFFRAQKEIHIFICEHEKR